MGHRPRPDFTPSQPTLWAEQWFTPEECGWVYWYESHGWRTYEKPNGEIYSFAPEQEVVICKPIWDEPR